MFRIVLMDVCYIAVLGVRIAVFHCMRSAMGNMSTRHLLPVTGRALTSCGAVGVHVLRREHGHEGRMAGWHRRVVA